VLPPYWPTITSAENKRRPSFGSRCGVTAIDARPAPRPPRFLVDKLDAGRLQYATYGLVVSGGQEAFAPRQLGPMDGSEAFTLQAPFRQVFADLARRDFAAARFGA
jgi:hypothetical protein